MSPPSFADRVIVVAVVLTKLRNCFRVGVTKSQSRREMVTCPPTARPNFTETEKRRHARQRVNYHGRVETVKLMASRRNLRVPALGRRRSEGLFFFSWDTQHTLFFGWKPQPPQSLRPKKLIFGLWDRLPRHAVILPLWKTPWTKTHGRSFSAALKLCILTYP